jgi:hypothetical protein
LTALWLSVFIFQLPAINGFLIVALLNLKPR